MKHIPCAVAVLCTLLPGLAKSSHEPCHPDHDSVIVFGNGIKTSEPRARQGRDRIAEVIAERVSGEEFQMIEFDLAYNQSYGLVADLYESLEQRFTSDNIAVSFWRWMGGQEQVPDTVREELLAMANRFDASEMVGTDDLAIHLEKYRTAIHGGKKILTVCHSQGNFFCNAAHSVLYSGDDPIGGLYFGLVSVANPASFVADDGPYTTLTEDLVIQSIALTAGSAGMTPPLPSNITNARSGAVTSDWKGHAFNEEYMAAGSRTVEKIAQDIINVRGGLAQPVQQDCMLPEPPPPEPVTHTACNDGIDNDGDGLVDWNGGNINQPPDPGCTGPTDTNEFNIIRIGGG